ncbi:MAG: hypothetical protein KGQ88_09055, partial [Chloroflexi bacterium]|nr:hypothetical protein [Chloroflexota bacterium]
MAGELSGAHTYVVDRARYAQIVTGSTTSIQRFSAAALAATIDRAGPLRDRLVTLADGLTDVSNDADTYAAGGDPQVFARVVADVVRAWDDLRAIQRMGRPVDNELARTIARGSSFVVEASAKDVYAVTAGPYPTLGEADAAAKRIGNVEQVSHVAPFLVTIGTYAGQKDADAAVTATS